MKQTEIQVRKEVKRLIAYIRNYNCHQNENSLQIHVKQCGHYGATVRVYPSQYYPWFGCMILDYFRAWSIVTDWNFIVESKNGVAVITLYYYI